MGAGLRNLLCSVPFIACFILQSNAASQQKQHLPFVMAVGTVYCDTCFQQEFSTFSHFIPGASIAVKCDGIGKNKLTFQKEVKTNQLGVFKILLPLEVVSRNGKEIKSCSVNLVRSSQPFCSVASSATSAGLRLKSIRNDVHVFSAGFFTFTPLKQPDVCNQKTKPSASAKYSLADQKRMQSAFFFMPPIPFLPSPPNIGGIPLPPNPFQPPPSILPPLPFQPSPPPFINVPPLPSIPPLPNIPPLPSLAPPPPPPPASIFPPLPFPPIFPGNPPASPVISSGGDVWMKLYQGLIIIHINLLAKSWTAVIENPFNLPSSFNHLNCMYR